MRMDRIGRQLVVVAWHLEAVEAVERRRAEGQKEVSYTVQQHADLDWGYSNAQRTQTL